MKTRSKTPRKLKPMSAKFIFTDAPNGRVNIECTFSRGIDGTKPPESPAVQLAMKTLEVVTEIIRNYKDEVQG